MLATEMSATVTMKAMRAPTVNFVENAVTNAPCSARSIASPPRAATNAAGAAIIAETKNGANRPKPIASTPNTIAAVYWPSRLPPEVSSAFVGPVRQRRYRTDRRRDQ